MRRNTINKIFLINVGVNGCETVWALHSARPPSDRLAEEGGEHSDGVFKK